MTWTRENAVDKTKLAQYPPSWPNEMLVKVLSSLNYSPIIGELSKDAKVLEVGIFSGNNSRFFLENDYILSGSEINEEMIELCRENLSRLGYEIPNLAIGDNTSLSYKSELFDLMISINTIHYSSGENTKKALNEFRRVLKPNGWAVIETPGTEHFVVKESIRKDELRYEWHAGGFREGLEFGFFDSIDHFKSIMLEFFAEVQVCRRLEIFPGVTLEFWMAICKK